MFGVIPAVSSTGTDLQDTLRDGGRAGSSAAKHRLRATLVTAEIALATVLVTGAAAFYTSLSRLNSVDKGFDPSEVATLRLNMPMNRYSGEGNDSWSATNTFFENLLSQVRDIPGVRAAALSFRNPLEPGFDFVWGVQVRGQEELPRAQRPQAELQPVTPGYFETFGIPILQGRDVSDFDRKNTSGAVVISQTLANRLFPGQQALGQVIQNPPFWVPAGYPDASEVVGVVGDVKSNGLDAEASAVAYFPFAQTPMGNMRLVVKAEASAEALFPAIRQLIWSQDPYLPVDDMMTMEQAIASTTAPTRFMLALTGGFAVLALTLAAVGVFGIVSSSVTERTREIGVRRALGARDGSIGRLLLQQIGGLLAVGLFLGIGIAQVASSKIQDMVFQTGTASMDVLLTTSVVLLLVGATACVIPGRRALKIDPITVLRSD